MNKSTARRIARHYTITYGEIRQVLRTVREHYPEDHSYWKQPTALNPSFTKGYFFNIYWRGIQARQDDEVATTAGGLIFVKNVLVDFGEFCPWDDPDPPSPKPSPRRVVQHQPPLNIKHHD